MWKQLIDLGKQYLSLARKTQNHEEDIKEIRDELKGLQKEVRALAELVQQSRWEQRHDRDMAAKDRENLLLRLELYLERSGRSLPPGSAG